ncbi:MAG: pyruvate kinase [Anaerostipes sp.]|nr:pyruvate kinase [Anaerostipes sp.]
MVYYGTLGPACADMSILRRMFRQGMTGVRLNLSHKSLESSKDWIFHFQAAAAKEGILKPELLVDLQGPELRIGRMNIDLEWQDHQEVYLDSLPLPKVILPYLIEGQEILIDDGKILLRVEERLGEEAEDIRCKVIRGGKVVQRKSIALPGLSIPVPTLTEADKENLKVAKEYGVTGVMLPFVRNKEDLLILREELKKNDSEDIRIFAKLENLEGVEMLPDLLDAADEIVIARGDLGNAVELWKLPRIQKEIAAQCRKAGKGFMVVTQMLSSMEVRAVPTRAEVCDIFNAVLDGASSVMLTGETAVGRYPVEAMSYLIKTSEEALVYQNEE